MVSARIFFMDPWYVATSRMGAGCFCVVCIACRLSIPSSDTYIHLTGMRASFNLFLGRLGRERFWCGFLGTLHVIIGGLWGGWPSA